MKQFDNGWWDCFLSYTDELAQFDRDFYQVAKQQLKGAGCNKNEIECVLKNKRMSDKTKYFLIEYKSNIDF